MGRNASTAPSQRSRRYSGVRPRGFGDASVGVVIWAMTKPNILTVVLLVAVLSTACNTSTLSYLENDIPPCVPVDQSTKDPCAQQEFPHIGIGGASVYLEEIPAYWELYYSGRAGHPDVPTSSSDTGNLSTRHSSLCRLRNKGTRLCRVLRCRQSQASISYTVLSMYK